MRTENLIRLIAIGLALISVVSPAQCLLSSPAEYGISSEQLTNGLEVIVIENHQVPLVTIVMAVKNGACVETPEYDGLSHLYEHMFFKANEAIPNQEAYLERTRELGMVWNGFTSQEAVVYFFTMYKDDMREGMIFMRNAIETPLFDEAELERERQVVLAEYDRADADPFHHLMREVDKELWYAYPWRKDVLGNRTIIATATQEKLRTIQQSYYIPNNCALIVAGDVEPAKVFDMAEGVFSEWQKREDPSIKYPIPIHPPLGESRSVVVTRPVNAITLMVEWQGPSVFKNPQDTYAADVFSLLLDNPSSKFQKNLVDSGLFTSCSLRYTTLNNTGPIMIVAQTDVEHFAEAKEALIDEIKKFDQPNYFTAEELANAKNQLVTSRVYETERASDFAITLTWWWCAAGLNYYLGYNDNVSEVDRAAINRYVDTYILDKPFAMGTLLSEGDQQILGLEGGVIA